ncbi:MAG: class I SAM-dependent methyltransferase [Gammaproteobacteria bacterium]
MSRLAKFNSVFGENWVVGKYLLPMLGRLGREQHGVLLDLACGESPFRVYFPKVKAYLRVDRTPLDPGAISGDMLAIPLANQSVDVVLLFQAITDVSNPVDVLKEVRRVLRPGGQLLIFESMAYPEHDTPYDFYRLMPDGLRALAVDAGLNLQECMRLGGLFTRFASLWNTFVMGEFKRHAALRPFGYLGIAGANLLCYALDRLLLHPRLASDYLAVLTHDSVTLEASCSSAGSSEL